MTSAILDTNIVVQSLIGSPRAGSARVMLAYFSSRFELIYSDETMDELHDVLMLDRMRDRHGFDETEILTYLSTISTPGRRVHVTREVSPAVTRDVTDAKFLALAVDSGADFLVTNDRRHLLPIGEFEGTQIVTPTEFLRRLP